MDTIHREGGNGVPVAPRILHEERPPTPQEQRAEFLKDAMIIDTAYLALTVVVFIAVVLRYMRKNPYLKGDLVYLLKVTGVAFVLNTLIVTAIWFFIFEM